MEKADKEKKIFINRLVLIGNGFDLAHGMKTSYCDFLTSYLNMGLDRLIRGYRYPDVSDESFVTMQRSTYIPRKEGEIWPLERLADYYRPEFSNIPLDPTAPPGSKDTFAIIPRESFITRVLNNASGKKWVDVEKDYFQEIKAVHNRNLNDDLKSKTIKLQNESLRIFKSKFVDYLSKIPKPKIGNSKIQGILNKPFQSEAGLNFLNYTNDQLEKVRPIETLLVNFNYTSTADFYLHEDKENDHHMSLINIHGRLSTNSNHLSNGDDLVFGYGNETDDLYKALEQEDDPGFLENVKSFYYFKDSKYHNILRFIEANPYEIFVFGHSCGITDHTLLNLIFEHKFCHSIRVFYHQKEPGVTNYLETTQNIARLFNDKALLRRRVIPFTNCVAFPQILST